MKTVIFTLILLASLTNNVASAAQDSSAAMITNLNGKILAAGKAVNLFAKLSAGSAIELKKDSKVTLVLLSTGKEYTLTGPAKVEISVSSIDVDSKAVAGKTLLASNEESKLTPHAFAQPATVMRAPKWVN